MKINIWKNQKEIEKTYEVNNYDLMYGTVEDILGIMEEGSDAMHDNNKMFELLVKNRSKLEDLLIDVFASEGMTKEDLRMVKLTEMVPVFIDLMKYVQKSFAPKN